jgi:predicted  nucleic acid-binding Zn ribbon protein
MEFIQGGIDKALSLLKDAPTVAAQKAHIDWLHDQLSAAEKRMREISDENTELLRENRDLRKRLEEATPKDNYYDGGICLFKIDKDGNIGRTPLCHKCKLPIAQLPMKRDVYMCTGCKAVFGQGAIQAAKEKIPVKQDS